MRLWKISAAGTESVENPASLPPAARERERERVSE